MSEPRVLAFGGGVNSTAMLVGLRDRDRLPDLVLFADTGAERPETYDHVRFMSQWLEELGCDPIQWVQNDGIHRTLENECLTNHQLPSLAYGWKKCSQKYKHRPQNKFVSKWPPAIKAWESGGKVVKLIGYDADEPHRAGLGIREDARYRYEHPLLDWGWGRQECIDAISEAGIEPPGKSACFFCPASKKPEIRRLAVEHPDLFARDVEMERNAEGLETVRGLGRHWSWDELVSSECKQPSLFPEVMDEPCFCYDGGES